MRQLIAITLIFGLISSGISKRSSFKDEDDSVFKKAAHHKQTSQDDPAYSRLEEILDHPLGAKILQTIALQMKGNESLSPVSKLLNDLRTDLEAKQIDADTEKTQILSQCKSDLENYAQRVSLSVNEIKDSEFKAKRLNEAVDLYEQEIEEKETQIDTLQTKDQTLRETRTQDSLDYAGRTQQMKEMIQAFEVILPKLHSVYDAVVGNPNKNFLEEDKINSSLVELAKIGADNPITAMVALTSTLEPASVQSLIEKLEDIRDSLQESLATEDDQEAKHARDSDVILSQIFNAIENLTREKSSDEEALQETIRNKDIQTKRAHDAHAEFTAAKNGNDQRRSQCEEYQVQYEQNTIERTKQVTLIKDVQNTIATKLEVVTEFVQENNLF